MSMFLYQDIFVISELDKEGKFFDRVSRLYGRTEGMGICVELDVNTEVYPVKAGERFSLVLADTLFKDGTQSTTYTKKLYSEDSHVQDYEYVCSGTVFVKEEDKICVSFGGLLLLLGTKENIGGLDEGKKVFLLMKKIN
uniref:DNA-directed RNA polymerases I, II, and III subunit RPABC3 n=1 Tax=Metchnikovella dogieli TaxID=2804710 RepID=A0A896WDE8_9MICR|nr:DNA-directed RNApolymerases I II III subunit RPABC3 [Metchnikovella dogieli]